MQEIPECFYRVSVKALILNEKRDKFLVCLERNGKWSLPGGGLDWGATPQEDLPREIKEEMGLAVVKIADNPCYFITELSQNGEVWMANILYEAELNDIDFTSSYECMDIKFVNSEDINEMQTFASVATLADMFNPKKHIL